MSGVTLLGIQKHLLLHHHQIEVTANHQVNLLAISFEKIVPMAAHRRAKSDGQLKPEPLLVDNPGRFVISPIQHENVRFPFLVLN